jgi:hypothetical protein
MWGLTYRRRKKKTEHGNEERAPATELAAGACPAQEDVT